MEGMSAIGMEELDVLCRSLFAARSRASSKAAAAVAGRFALVTESDGPSEALELLVIESNAFAYNRFLVAIAWTLDVVAGSADVVSISRRHRSSLCT